MEKLGTATTAGRFQLTTDGFNAYPNAVEYNFGARVDYAQLVKEFAGAGRGRAAAVRSSPPYRRRKDRRERRASRRADLHLARRTGELDAARPPTPDDPTVERV
jgi:hypothetical protein